MDENFYPKEFDLEDRRLSVLAYHAAIEIETFMKKLEPIAELNCPSSRLAKILNEKITELEKLQKRDLCRKGDVLFALRDTLYEHENESKGKTSYKIKHDLKTFPELRDILVPVMYRVSENLKSFKNLPKNRQEILRDLTLNLSRESQKYSQIEFRRYVA